MALMPTQPVAEMSTGNISCRVKVAGWLGSQPYHFNVPHVLKSGSLNLLELSGTTQAFIRITHNIKYFAFPRYNCYANAPQCYIIRTVRVLLH